MSAAGLIWFNHDGDRFTVTPDAKMITRRTLFGKDCHIEWQRHNWAPECRQAARRAVMFARELNDHLAQKDGEPC